jgi:hypothetical protein
VKQSEKSLIAACDGYCGGCSDYLAYINNDEKLKEKLAAEFSKQFNMDIKPEDIGCLGCHGSIRKPWCASCFIRQCTEEKGILTCAFCDDFPCKKLEKHYEKIKYGDKSRAHMLRQREIGLEKWLEEMKKAKTQETLDQ